jgi:hypothetical protein
LFGKRFRNLEKDLEIKLPEQLIGQTIKQVEMIPKHSFFMAVFVYEPDDSQFKQVCKNNKIMSYEIMLIITY